MKRVWRALKGKILFVAVLNAMHPGRDATTPVAMRAVLCSLLLLSLLRDVDEATHSTRGLGPPVPASRAHETSVARLGRQGPLRESFEFNASETRRDEGPSRRLLLVKMIMNAPPVALHAPVRSHPYSSLEQAKFVSQVRNKD